MLLRWYFDVCIDRGMSADQVCTALILYVTYFSHNYFTAHRCLGSGGEVADCEYDELGEAIEENKPAAGGAMGGVLPLLQVSVLCYVALLPLLYIELYE